MRLFAVDESECAVLLLDELSNCKGDDRITGLQSIGNVDKKIFRNPTSLITPSGRAK